MQERGLDDTMLARVAGVKVLGKSPTGAYLRLNRPIWDRLPAGMRKTRLVNSYGELLHKLVCLHSSRQVFVGTFFLRNRPALELMRRLAARKGRDSELRIAVLGCSIGAEVYSIMWSLRSALPGLKVRMVASDISEKVLNYAKRGVYDQNTWQFLGTPPEESIFERLTEGEKQGLFDWAGGQGTIKACFREGITWDLGDALDPELVRRLGPQDMVFASNFLCHLPRADAEKCLRNIAKLVKPGGYVFVTGVDLDIRTKVAKDLGWRPIPDSREEIHDGDPSIRGGWPWAWWGLEPLNKNRKDWEVRYTCAFQVNQAA